MNKDDRGFTLIELLLYVGIVAIVLSAIISFAWQVILSGSKSSQQQEVFATARYLSERVIYEIRNALDINVSSSNFNSNLANNPGQKLSLHAASANDPTLIDVSNGKLRITQGSSAAVNLNSNDSKVTDLTFTNNSSGDAKTKNISFTLTVQSAYSGTRQEFTASVSLQSSAEVRNN